jgi:2,3-bisphosphoglycerate-dependent phosphoglycerate mutase
MGGEKTRRRVGHARDIPAVSEILLVRHCTSCGQEPDARLADAGLQQAVDLAEALARHAIDHVVSSPFRRALQTIAPFAVRAGLPVHEDVRLAERTLSAEPLDDWLEQLHRTWEDFDYRAPGGETSREAQLRGRAVVDEIAGAGHRCAVLVSHGNLIGLVLQSIDSRFDYEAWTRLTNPDLFRLVPRGDSYSVERLWEER